MAKVGKNELFPNLGRPGLARRFGEAPVIYPTSTASTPEQKANEDEILAASFATPLTQSKRVEIGRKALVTPKRGRPKSGPKPWEIEGIPKSTYFARRKAKPLTP